MQIIVAIDGPAGVGKSTIADMVAKKLEAAHINSGDLYRAVTYLFLQTGIEYSDEAILRIAKKTKFSISNRKLHIESIEKTELLHTDLVDSMVAKISSLPELREVINKQMRELCKNNKAVVEGRDIGTVVFPDTPYKFFLDASIKERARRRYNQGTSKKTLQELEETIAERDKIDKNKEKGALRPAEDAIYIDTSDLTIQQVYEKVLEIIESISLNRSMESVMADKEKINIDTTTEEQAPAATAEQEELQEMYLKNIEELSEGALVEGTVVEINNDYVYLDVGYKSEGQVPISDFDELPKINDTVSVIIVKKETSDGHVLVSKKKADQKSFWKTIKESFQEKKPIKATIKSEIKGGFVVDFGYDVTGFLPYSQVDIDRIENSSEYIGLESFFYIEKLFSNKRVNIVVSRRKYLEEERDKKRQEFFETKKEGDIVEGIVKSYAPFGAFIDLGGFDGLLHIQDMSWGRATRPKDYVKKGKKIQVKIVKLDKENFKVNLSLKELKEDPWSSFATRYAVGDVVEGTVTKLMPFGAFVEIEEGIEGLVHVSELSWVKNIKHPKEVLKTGKKIQAKILDYDVDERRLSLGIRQLQENPWDTIEERYPVGMRTTRPIKEVVKEGVVVELEDGIEAFMPVDNISWKEKISDATTLYTAGQELEFCITRVDKRRKRIQIGVKQLSENPWKALAKAYPEGSIIEATVKEINENGVVVTVQNDLEGFIPNRQLSDTAIESPEKTKEKIKEGDKLNALVLELKPAKHRLILSVREKVRREQKEEMGRYLHKDDNEATFTMADLLSKSDDEE
ncbi:30S ribosomal protein S1 [Spirochaetia bacterium 38H-sp]|uniref:Cytidylate kinase n=1 Tax=Rarispira pelagica TaxID=3141764 RepID=A0ABU9UAP2_9SPIR